MTQNSQIKATLVGLIAIGGWATLAVLSVWAKGIPPFELLSLNTGVAFLGGLVVLALRGPAAFSVLRQPFAPWIAAVGAIFLYHAMYFYAVATIPPARASLIAYLWPLLIVILTALLPGGDSFRMRHLVGACLGLFGVFIMVTDRAENVASAGTVLGYLAAASCAFIWSGYSLFNRRYATVPSEMLIGVCGAVSVLAGVIHLCFETSVTPNGDQWMAIVMLGVGPVGLTFLAWDHASKHGNLALLGVLAFLTPVLSIVLLVFARQAPATVSLAIASVLVVAGAVVASMQSPTRTHKHPN